MAAKEYSNSQKARTSIQDDYPAKLSFRMEGKIKCFPDKVKLKEFIITKPSLYERELFTKKIKTMNIKMTINLQLSTIESKKQTKQTSRTETESQNWRPLGWWPAGRGF